MEIFSYIEFSNYFSGDSTNNIYKYFEDTAVSCNFLRYHYFLSGVHIKKLFSICEKIPNYLVKIYSSNSLINDRNYIFFI